MNVHASWCGSAPQAGRGGHPPGRAFPYSSRKSSGGATLRLGCRRTHARPRKPRHVFGGKDRASGILSIASSAAAPGSCQANTASRTRRRRPLAALPRIPGQQAARGALALQALFLFGFAQGDSSPRYGLTQSGAAGRAKGGLATKSAAPPAQARAGIFRRDRSGLNRTRRLAGGQRSIVMVRTPEKLPACM